MKTQHLTFRILAIVLLAVTFSSCEKEMFGIRGTGPIVTEELSIDEFSGIELEGSFDVIIEYGAEQMVTVEGHRNIIDRLQTRVSDGIWKIKLRPAQYYHVDMTITITSPHIDKIFLAGSGNIETSGFQNIQDLEVVLFGSGRIWGREPFVVSGKSLVTIVGSGDIDLFLETNRLSSEILGSGNIYLSGTANDMSLEIQGSGHYEAYSMVSENCDVSILSSGNAYVYANQTLDATITGSGNIYYKGSPSVDVSITGSGNIKNSN